MKIALLPLYVKLYDDFSPANHEKAQKFADDAVKALEKLSFEVITLPLCRVAEEGNYPLVHLGDLGVLDENKAIGLFEHTGVAAHPGDLGMYRIAERIAAAILKITEEAK